MTVENYKKILSERLTEYRYYHCICVAEAARKLATKNGEDADKAYTAGLLHDITKDTSDEEQLKIFEKYGMQLTEVERASPQLWHAMSGALIIKHELGIDDEVIFDAVRYHTTAKGDLSRFGKIIYLADFISADRKYPDIEEARAAVWRSLEEGYEYTVSYTIGYLYDRKRLIHPDTLDAYNSIMLKKEKENGNI